MEFTAKTIGEIESLIKTGKTPPSKKSEYYIGEINWYTPGDLDKEKYLSTSQRTVTKQAIKDKKVSMLPKNTVLIGAIGDIGKLGITSEESCSNQQITGLIPNEEVHFEYLYYWLKSHKRQLRKFATNAIVPILNNKALRSIKISYPKNIDDQKRIAKILSDCEALIQKRTDSIELLDKLLKSTFLEMFGENLRSKNPEEWSVLGNEIDVLTDFHANGSYKTLKANVSIKTKKDYALMVRTTDLENNSFENDCIYINEDEYNYLSKSKVFGGELIITKIGSAGNVYLMPRLNIPVSLGMNAFLARLKNEELSTFIYHYLTSAFGNKQIMKRVKGAVTKTITKDAVRDIPFPVVAKTKIENFNNSVTNIKKLKSLFETSLTELENLYGSISQRAFKGELNLEKVDISDMEDDTQEKPEMEPIGDPRWEGKVEIQDYQVHIDEIIKKDFENSSFSFKQLEDAIADRGVYVPYDNVKEFVFKSLEGNNSLLVQEMDEKEKQIVFKIR